MVDLTKNGNSKSEKSDKNEPENCMADFASNPSTNSHVNITDMIRSLQRTEGVNDCFRRGLSECEQIECAWRQYCLDSGDGSLPLKKT